MMGMSFDSWLEISPPWANLLGHVARGQDNNIGRRGKELGIDQAFGGTGSTAWFDHTTALLWREEMVSEECWDGGTWT